MWLWFQPLCKGSRSSCHSNILSILDKLDWLRGCTCWVKLVSCEGFCWFVHDVSVGISCCLGSEAITYGMSGWAGPVPLTCGVIDWASFDANSGAISGLEGSSWSNHWCTPSFWNNGRLNSVWVRLLTTTACKFCIYKTECQKYLQFNVLNNL